MNRLLLSLTHFSLACSPLLAAAPAPISANPQSLAITADQDKLAQQLIAKLGSKSFPERDEATRELHQMGRLALTAITKSLESEANPEIRMRCEMLLAHATADDIKARLDCFLADKEAKYNHNLPGAKEFFAVAGTTEDARNLFRDLALSPDNRPLIFGVGNKNEDLVKMVNERRNQFNNRTVFVGGVVQQPVERVNPTAQDIAALLFAESFINDKSKAGGRAGVAVSTVNSSSHLLTQPVFRAALESGKLREPLMGIVGKWIDTREDTYSLYMAMNTATNLKLPYAANCAKKLLDPKLSGPMIYKAMALTSLARTGTADEHLKLFEGLMKDEAVVTTVFVAANKRHPLQMRDAALAMALLLTKQDPIDYGMKSRYTGNVSELSKFNYSNYHFDDSDGKADEARKAAFKKYDEWKASQEAKGKK